MSAPTSRTQVHRIPERGVYERDTIDAILDEALICHVSWVDPDGGPRCLPTIHARVGDTVYLHGSRGARPWKALRDGSDVCVVATIVDGLVLAKSFFESSMNYRSVVLYGKAREITDEEELHVASRAIAAHVAPGREDEARMPTDDEYRQTLLLAIPLEETSAKVRTGGPKDKDEDADLPIWTGVLPLVTTPGTPLPAAHSPEGVGVPPSVTGYHRPGRE